MKKSILTIALAVMMLFAFVACDSQPTLTYKDVKRIEVAQTGDFVVGQSFDPSKFTVTAYYSDGSSEVVKASVAEYGTWEARSGAVIASLVTSTLNGSQTTLTANTAVTFEDFTGINFSKTDFVLEPTTADGKTYDYSATLQKNFKDLADGIKYGDITVSVVYGDNEVMQLSYDDQKSFLGYIKNFEGSEWNLVDEDAFADLMDGKLVTGEQEVVFAELETTDTGRYYHGITTNLTVTVEPDVAAEFDHYEFELTNDPYYKTAPAWIIYAVDTDGERMAENYTSLTSSGFEIINNVSIPSEYNTAVDVVVMRSKGQSHEGETVTMSFPAGVDYITTTPTVEVRPNVTVDPGTPDKTDYIATATWAKDGAKQLADSAWELVPGQVIKNSGNTNVAFKVTWDNKGEIKTSLVTVAINK